MLISSLWRYAPINKHVRVRRINRECMRVKLARASHVNAPRLVLNGKLIAVKVK